MFNVQKWLLLIANKRSKKLFFYENYTKKIVKSREISWCDSFFSMMIISLFSNRKYSLIVCRVEKDTIDHNQRLPSAVWYHWEMHWAWRSKALPFGTHQIQIDTYIFFKSLQPYHNWKMTEGIFSYDLVQDLHSRKRKAYNIQKISSVL